MTIKHAIVGKAYRSKKIDIKGKGKRIVKIRKAWINIAP